MNINIFLNFFLSNYCPFCPSNCNFYFNEKWMSGDYITWIYCQMYLDIFPSQYMLKTDVYKNPFGTMFIWYIHITITYLPNWLHSTYMCDVSSKFLCGSYLISTQFSIPGYESKSKVEIGFCSKRRVLFSR